jgi:GNAT superfamily N-acetyltransferase
LFAWPPLGLTVEFAVTRGLGESSLPPAGRPTEVATRTCDGGRLALKPTIDYLADHQDAIPTLAEWHHHQFRHLSPGSTVERCGSRLRAQPGRRQIPTTVVALADGQPLGSASLVAHDMAIRPELSPWLATVFVAPEYRRQGIGASLVRRIVEEAAALGAERLYLYTPDKEGFYSRRGWRTVERVDYRDHHVAVMAYDIGADPPGQAGEGAEQDRAE